METTGTFTIGLDTPIHLLTPRQLFEMQTEWMAAKGILNNNNKVEPEPSKPNRWLVTSIPELAKILGTSVSTLYRMKAQGELDDAISQHGRWMCIDVDMVLENFKLSNRRRRRK